MTVIAFVGKPRTGKTLGMTFTAYGDYNKGYEIFSNYELMFKHKAMSVEQMLNIPFEDVERNAKTLCIQEADKVFDSRRSMRNENVLLSSLTGQSGKRNLNIYYDTQFWNRIDGSLRAVTEFVVSTSCYIDSITKEPLAFEQVWEDMFDGSEKKIVLPAFLLSPFYKMYNNYEATRPLTQSRKMREIIGEKEDVK